MTLLYLPSSSSNCSFMSERPPRHAGLSGIEEGTVKQARPRRPITILGTAKRPRGSAIPECVEGKATAWDTWDEKREVR